MENGSNLLKCYKKDVSRKKGARETSEVLFYLARCGVVIEVKRIPMTPLC